MASEQELAEIKHRLPIEQVVGSYVPLKRAGRTLKANCPFHNEKSPSFNVNAERGIYKCFGCGEGGDIFDFVMKYEGLTFPETVRLLAEKAGVELSESTFTKRGGERPADEVPRDRLFKVNDFVATLWNRILLEHPKAEAARNYLLKRGLTTKTISELQIGYAPPGTATTQALAKAGFTNKELQSAGDPTKFQDRIVFPITDLTGRIIGFTGRILILPDDPPSKAERGPKYWNTPETPIFIKSRAVYNIQHAKHAIQTHDAVLLAEGQMDVAMLYQFGYPQAVASSGTALTEDQLKLLSRFSTNIVFAYDGDNAGINATKRGLELALGLDLTPWVITIANGKDPADCLLADPDLWEQSYAKRVPAMQWLIEQIIPTGRELTPSEKKSYAKELLPWLGRITNPLEQKDWLRKLAGYLQTDEATLQSAFVPGRSVRREESPELEHAQEVSLTPVQQWSETVCALLLAFPELVTHLTGKLSVIEPSTPYLKLAGEALAQPNLNGYIESEAAAPLVLQTEEKLNTYSHTELTPPQALQEVMQLLQRISESSKEHIKDKLARDIQQAQMRGDTEKVKELFEQLRQSL